MIARMNVGGTARYLGKLIEEIPSNVLATGYVQGSEIEDSCVQNLHVIRIPHLGREVSLLKDFLAWLELRKIVKELKPKVIHTHTFKAGIIGRLVKGNHKRVHTFHGHLFDDQSFSFIQKKLIRVIESFLAKKTDILVSVGEKVGVELRALGIGNNKKWISIAPGVNALPKIEKGQARRILGISNNEVLIGWMARMDLVKNPFLLLDVAKRLPKINFIVGGGGTLLEEVKKRAPNNAKILGWTDASLFWSAADCALSTSDNEGMPIALIEAQLAGLPVITTNVGSNGEVIENGITGILTTKNVDEVVQAVKKLHKNKILRNRLGAAAKSRAEKEFSLAKMIDAHKNIYRSIVGEINENT